jgi:DNA mismatch repair protein MutS
LRYRREAAAAKLVLIAMSEITTKDSTAPAESKPALSPAMRQYQQFKSQYPGYVLFFRMGDFYEMFWDDAKLAARVLGVALTSRSRGGLDAEDAIPMAGVPFHAVDGYLRKMIAAGHKVAICEQMENPSEAKGVIRRDVVRLMTPGTITDDPLLDGRADNYLAAVAFGISKSDGYKAALAWVELSTGQCAAMSGTEGQVLDEIARLRPAEVLVPELASGQPHELSRDIQPLGDMTITSRPDWQFSPHHAREQFQKQWQLATTEGLGFTPDDPAVIAAAALLSYLGETQRTSLAHIRPPKKHLVEKHLSIDPATWRSLEIDRTVRAGTIEGSLLSAIDRTRTSMGARLLRQWIRTPLADVEHIRARQAAIAALLAAPEHLSALSDALDDVCDIERIIARVSLGRVPPRDLAALCRCLKSMPALLDRLAALPARDDVAPELPKLRDFCVLRRKYLTDAIQSDPAPHLREGGVIAPGFDDELDRLRLIGANSAQWLASYQARLSSESGIPTLKVGFNKVFGYYIEVTDAHRPKVPSAWTRKQTVKNAERYITEELKNLENEALGAQEKSIALEQELYERVRQELLLHIPIFAELAQGIARLDVLSSLAMLARDRRYCRPEINEDRAIEIIDGRHPVLEQQLSSQFVSNDTRIGEDQSLALITGPNMAGKSTYIRQVALITLLAQIGSYVPAKSATIGMADRLFARIGASDEIHGGQSTFMVEMIETANILNNATDRSLVVLDEIGRGTSTLDGLSLAWAIAEQIAVDVRCRTLFATHYHELTELAARIGGIFNLNVAVREWEDQVVFLHRIVEGRTDRSYGIHVARLAGIPPEVLGRAKQLLSELAVQHVASPKLSRRGKNIDANQLQLFADPAREIATELAGLDTDNLSEKDALETLRRMKKKITDH